MALGLPVEQLPATLLEIATLPSPITDSKEESQSPTLLNINSYMSIQMINIMI